MEGDLAPPPWWCKLEVVSSLMGVNGRGDFGVEEGGRGGSLLEVDPLESRGLAKRPSAKAASSSLTPVKNKIF